MKLRLILQRPTFDTRVEAVVMATTFDAESEAQAVAAELNAAAGRDVRYHVERYCEKWAIARQGKRTYWGWDGFAAVLPKPPSSPKISPKEGDPKAVGIVEPAPKSVTIEEYRAALKGFDASVCEALAVSQAAAGRIAAPHDGYATHIFTRICGQAIALIRAVPESTWARSDAEFWDFSGIAGYSRAIVEGQLLLFYIIKKPESPEEWSARLNVMHLNDCSRRIKILDGMLDGAELAAFLAQAEEIRERLRGNRWFCALDEKMQKRLLSGDVLTISTRDDQIAELGWNKREFYSLWHLLSQYTHILPLSFYRLEPNGRGTGIANDFDRAYIYLMLDLCTKVLNACVDRIVESFPDTASARTGIDSKFSPGPSRNRPRTG
jgi:hypothetical protein